MITDLFTIDKGKVSPSLHCHLIPEFKYIIDKYGDRAIHMLAYAFYMGCPYKTVNPYADMSEDDREEILKRDFAVFPDNLDILNAIEKVEKLYMTTASKYMVSIKNSLFKTMDYLDTSALSDGRDGNITDVRGMQKEAGAILESFQRLEKSAEEELGKLRSKANRKIGKDEL